MNVAFAISFSLCAVFAVTASAFHFWIIRRLGDAGFPVKWFGNPMDILDAWARYYSEARTRQWPLWPYTAVRTCAVLFIATTALMFWLLNRIWT